MKFGVILLVAALLGVGYIGLPVSGAVYQDNKLGTITIRVSVPEEAVVPPVSNSLPAPTGRFVEEVPLEVAPTSSTTVPATSQPSESQAPEAPVVPAPVEEEESSDVQVTP